MAESKAVEKKTEIVEGVVENTTTDETPRTPELEKGVYTEFRVELGNGVKVDVSVIVDRDMLPASFSTLVAEGNVEAMIIAQVTDFTRKMLDFAGATRKDLRDVIAPVVERAQEAADKDN